MFPTTHHTKKNMPDQGSTDTHASPNHFTITTWNIRGFRRPNVNELAELLQSGAPAVVVVLVLQEVQRRQARRFSQLLSMHHHWSLKHSPIGRLLRNFSEGLGVFSTDSLFDCETVNLTPTVKVTDHRRRLAQFAYLSTIDADIVNVHLASHRDHRARAVQLELILNRIATRGARRCIVAGDFNAAEEPDLYGLLTGAGFLDAWDDPSTPVLRSDRPGYTNPAGRASKRLDRVFVRGFQVEHIDVPQDGPLWMKRSDHLPVTATLSPS